MVVAVVHRAACRRIGGCVELHEQRRGLAGVDARERGNRDGAHVGGLTQLDMAFVTGIYRGGVGVALGRYGLFHPVGRKGELVAVRAVDRYARPAVLGVGLNPVCGNPAEVVLQKDGAFGVRVGGRHLDELDFTRRGVLRECRVGNGDGHRGLVALAVGAGRRGHADGRALQSRALHRRDAHPRVVAQGDGPVEGARYVERRRSRLFGHEDHLVVGYPLDGKSCGVEGVLTQLDRHRLALLRGESRGILAGESFDGDAGLVAGVLRQLDGLFRVAGVQVVAAVGADGEFTRALLARVLVGNDRDFEPGAGLTLLGGDDEPALRLGDFPRGVAAQQEGLGLLCRIEEREALVGYVLCGYGRGQRLARTALRLVLRAASRCQERCAEERQKPFVA